MPVSTTGIYNLGQPLPRAGLRRRDYSNSLHRSVPRSRALGNDVSASSTAEAKAKVDEKPFDAPPESSSDEEGKTSPQAADNDTDDGFPQPRVARSRPGVNARKPRAPPRGHSWSKLEPTGQDAEDEKEEIVFDTGGASQRKGMRKFGSTNKRSSNIHTEAMPSTRPAKKQAVDKKPATNGFKVPAGAGALAILDAAGSQSTKSSGRPVFREPRPPLEEEKKSKKSTGKRIQEKETVKENEDTKPKRSIPEFRTPIEVASLPSKTSSSSSQPSSPLSSTRSSPHSPAHSFDLDREPPSSMTTLMPSTADNNSSADEPKCPMCDAPIPASQLSDFITAHLPSLPPAARLSVRQQNLFCNHHKRLDAQSTWHARGYPDINWALLPSRLDTLVTAHVRAVIADNNDSNNSNDSGSFFYRRRVRRLHAAQQRKGGRQTVARELEAEGDGAELLGYYGGKGARVVGDWLLARFRAELKGAVAADRDLARCGGLGGFVQAVLVPEVVCRLVMADRAEVGAGEDGVDGVEDGVGKREEEARRIMEESSALGRLLCEEDEDEVLSEEEDVL